eukprot:m.9280 g.9280  ORF g.9280 m.9280 type:complete len:250 (-) comp3418_c0_seq2:104-853(-)
MDEFDVDGDMPPPLEECEDMLALRNKLVPKGSEKDTVKNDTDKDLAVTSSTTKKIACNNNSSSNKNKTAERDSLEGKVKKPAKNNKSSSKSSGFGGLSAGFLLGGDTKQKKKKKKSTPAKDSIPTIKPKNPSQPKGVLPEVQQAMKDAAPFMERTKDQWLNTDLIQKFQSNPFLLECLSDPSVIQALKELETNPGAAKQKYANNPRVLKFFQEYFQLMGAHFTTIGEKEGKTEKQSSNSKQYNHLSINQ